MALAFTASQMACIRRAAAAEGVAARSWVLNVVLARSSGFVDGDMSVEVPKGLRDFPSDMPRPCVDESCAVEFLEGIRWSDGCECPECGSVDVYQMQDRESGGREKNYRWRCRGCGVQFTVRAGSFLSESRVGLRHWLSVILADGVLEGGVRAGEIEKAIGVSRRTGMFMLDRLRAGGEFGVVWGFEVAELFQRLKDFVDDETP